MPALEVAGRAVFHLGGPEGPPDALPLVCLHGAGGSAALWTQLQAASHGARPVYALDLPGHGRSDPLDGAITIDAYAGAVRRFCDAAGLGRAVFVGHSMGGAIALRLALDASDRVAGLVLVATGARLRVAPEVLSALASDLDAAVERICRLCYGPGTPPDLLARGVAEMRRTPPGMLEEDFRACDRFDVRDRLGEIEAQALVLVGEQDVMTPPRYATYLGDHLPGAEVQVFPGAGHMLPVEAPGPLAVSVTAFVSRL